MKSKISFQNILPYLIVLAVFLATTFAYFSPLLNGKVLSMHDINMASGAAKEVQDFYKNTGEYSWWTNSMFGGMPTFMIYGGYPFSLISTIGAFLTDLLPTPANIFFLLMLGFFVLMEVLKINRIVGVLASIAYAFSTYNLVFIEAGHISKILALVYLPGILAGFNLIFRKKYFIGTFLTALFLGLELYANHLQITYYFFFVLLAYSVYEFIALFKKEGAAPMGKIVLSFFVAALIGVGMHTERLWNNLVYSKETTRGQSELTQQSSGQSGLDRDYAFAWSYGVNESFNMIVPNLMGGSSVGALDENSETFQLLARSGVDRGNAKMFVSNLPLYHGPQSSTAGPAYTGVIVFFIFVFGLFYRKDSLRWLQLGMALFLVMLAWGSNFSALNYFMFDHFPGYNKFRAVSIVLTIAHLVFVWGAAQTLNDLIEKKDAFEKVKTPLLYALGVVLVLMCVGYMGTNFVGARDGAFLESLKTSLGDNLANQLMNALRDDRASMALADIYRGVILILLVSALLFFYTKGKLKANVYAVLLTLLVVFDMFSVGKRYFNSDDFQRKMGKVSVPFQPTPADQQILQDKALDFRVLNLATNQGFMSDARDSYFHKSLGGYHGAKLKKYQELVDHELLKDGNLNFGVLNFLNTKYLITNGPSGEQAQMNPDAFGNAWFVRQVKAVSNADEELAEAGSIDAQSVAVTQTKFMAESKTYTVDSAATVTLKSYLPNKLVYESNSKQEGFIVFSEIYYRGNTDWLSSIDGKPADHIKVDYVLRGLEVPAGKHEIVFEFKPQSVEKGKIGDLVASIGLVLLAIAGVFYSRKKA
ncbi:hypothetical protein LAG90_19075 [Marinilongibacter aquaticus]|uniref:hypothetical protein n=1 Tax=Marinilongibacter aquaticus TaxID=2975157 RepID=UPI0021BD3CF0|nr:hypothetical protein [Marinilongibacter aquaticus]UBM58904.1 hypothetical protein LAG90_19075 [Marinilongibacter aquaticus]